MNEKKEEKKLVPPYISYKTFLNFMEQIKVGIPSRIDRSVMGRFSGIAQNQLFTTLRYLGLTNADDTPTEKLPKLIALEGTDKQKYLKEILIDSYPFLFKDGIDLKRTTALHLQDLFDKAGASGGTTRKCIAFFMAAAKHAGIELSPHVKSITRIRVSGKSKRRGTNGSLEHEHDIDETPSQTIKTQTWEQILAEKFPQFDPSWSPEVQEKWFGVFDKLIDKFKKAENEEKGDQQ